MRFVGEPERSLDLPRPNMMAVFLLSFSDLLFVASAGRGMIHKRCMQAINIASRCRDQVQVVFRMIVEVISNSNIKKPPR